MHAEANLAGMLSEAGRYAEAERHFEEAARLAAALEDPDGAQPVNLLGLRASHRDRQGRLGEAIADWREAIARLERQSEPDLLWIAELRCRIADARSRLREHDEALDGFARCEPVIPASTCSTASTATRRWARTPTS